MKYVHVLFKLYGLDRSGLISEKSKGGAMPAMPFGIFTETVY